MLQQTRVEVVREYYRRWCRQFPTLRSLARARPSRVLKAWEGLGYYSRARNLHRAAKLVVGRARPPGAPRTARRSVPTEVSELMQLPGIGRYTAGAIASIAFDKRAPVVDGNVARVFTRVFGRSGWDIAEALLPEKNCGDFNQALMELGALVCLPANPQCARCPLRGVCGRHALPRKAKRLKPVRQDVVFAARDGAVRLRQRPATGLLAGMWELPPGRSSRLLLTLRHTITNRRVTLRVFAGKNGDGRWVKNWRKLTMPAAHRRAVTAVFSAHHQDRALGRGK